MAFVQRTRHSPCRVATARTHAHRTSRQRQRHIHGSALTCTHIHTHAHTILQDKGSDTLAELRRYVFFNVTAPPSTHTQVRTHTQTPQRHSPLSVSVLCLPLNCSHLDWISSSTPLQIHLVSLQSSPDRTSRYRGSYSYLAPVYTLSSCFSC